VALGAGAARAQDRTLPAHLSAPTRAAIARVIDSARVAGVPVDPRYSKAQEGVFRGADDARVFAAVQRLAHDLGEARLALGDSAAAEEITAGANALRAGLRPADLVARSVPDDALISFRQTVERDLQSGRSPSSAFDARTRSMIDDAERRRP